MYKRYTINQSQTTDFYPFSAALALILFRA